MKEGVYTVARRSRTILQALLEPLDLLTRLVNNKHGYPSLELRQRVGNLNDFEGSNGEYLAYLKLLCDLKYGERLLDIGCGCGTMCFATGGGVPLPQYVQYYGLDIDEKAIQWCKKHILGGYFNVVRLNKKLPVASSSIDVVLCKSLFTHLLVHETRDYLGELNRVMAPGGRCLSTWFLLHPEEHPSGEFAFPHRMGAVAFERISRPSKAVAYDENWILGLLAQMNFQPKVYKGSWKYNTTGLSYQDIIVFTKGDK